MQYYDDLLDRLQKTIDETFADDEDHIYLDKRCIDDCLKDQLKLQLRWERIVAHAAAIHEEAKNESDYLFSLSYQNKMENDKRAWSTTDARILASSDISYQDMKERQVRAYKLKKESEGILSVIESRKYALKNMCDLLRDGQEKHII